MFYSAQAQVPSQGSSPTTVTRHRDYKWKNIGARIREARAKAGLTQKQVSELLGVSSHAVWCWEAGMMKPNSDHLVELAYRFAVSTDWILGADVVEAELLKEPDVSFRDAVGGLPIEDLEEIQEFIKYVRHRRRRKKQDG